MKSATQHRDLRTGRTPWQSIRVSVPPPVRLLRDRQCDVLVIGAGITGAMVAEALSAEGLHVIVCDRRPPLTGSTAASTALLQYEIDTPLVKLAKQIGREKAERIWRRSRLAVDALRERAKHLGFRGDLTNRDSIYLQGNVLDAHGLQQEAAARRRAGFEVCYLTAAEVESDYGIRGRAALKSFDNITANPRALAADFLRTAVARGAGIFSPEEIAAVRGFARGARAKTVSGRTIRARHVVFATGYELPECVPKRGHKVESTWVIATKPQPRALWQGPCLIWEASSPYLYLRTTPDGRVLCGGGDEPFADEATRDALLESKAAMLSRRLATLMPAVNAEAEFAWCGSFGASETGLPTIGPVPRMPNCYAVLGYGGNGITFSMMAAQMLRNILSGDGDPDLDLVAFRR